jgi:hypothetical protein
MFLFEIKETRNFGTASFLENDAKRRDFPTEEQNQVEKLRLLSENP